MATGGADGRDGRDGPDDPAKGADGPDGVAERPSGPDRVVADLVDVVGDVVPAPRRLLGVGTGRRFDVAVALATAFPDADVVVSDRTAPDLPDGVPANVRAAAVDLAADDPLAGAAGVADGPDGVDAVDAVVAVRLPPELWPDAVALADRLGAPLVMHPLPEETPPDGFEQVRPGIYARRPTG